MAYKSLAALICFLAYTAYNLNILYQDTMPPLARSGDETIVAPYLKEGMNLTYVVSLSETLYLPDTYPEHYVDVARLENIPYSWNYEHGGRLQNLRDKNIKEKQPSSANIESISSFSFLGVHTSLFSFFSKVASVFTPFNPLNEYHVEFKIPSQFRQNSTLVLRVGVYNADTNERIPDLDRVLPFTWFFVPQAHKKLLRYLLEDPYGEGVKERQKLIGSPPKVYSSVPTFIQFGPVIETRNFSAEHIEEMGIAESRSYFIVRPDYTYRFHVFVNPYVSPRDEFVPLIPLEDKHLAPDSVEAPTHDVSDVPIRLKYSPLGSNYRIFNSIIDATLNRIEIEMGFSQYDIDSLKMLAVGGSPWLLISVYLISLLHLIFEVISISSDVQFWRKKKNLQLFSPNSLIMDTILEIIILLYLRDCDESKIVQFFLVARMALNCWKLFKLLEFGKNKAFPYILKPREDFKFNSEYEVENRHEELQETKENNGLSKKKECIPSISSQEIQAFENKCLLILGLFILPFVAAVCIYQLVYVPQRGWYSWMVRSLAVCAYAGGFVTMTPQVFRNYKYKSVEHLPWTALTYQFINTFIDDIFSCCIRVPHMHKVSVFRDDIVFIIYVLQRCYYRQRRKHEAECDDKRKKRE